MYRDQKLAEALGLLMRLAHSLSASLPGVLPNTRLKVGKKKMRLTLLPEQAALNGPIIEKRLRAAAEAIGLTPELKVGSLKDN